MDSRLEAHIDEIFSDVPKTDKLVTMINRIKSKANAKYLQKREEGFSRSIAFNEVDDWLMKAKVIVDEEVGKLTPAEIAAIPKREEDYSPAGTYVTETMSDDDGGTVVVEMEDGVYGDYTVADESQEYAADESAEAPVAEEAVAEVAEVAEAPAKKEKAAKKGKEKAPKKSKKEKEAEEVEEDEIEVPVKSAGTAGKVIGGICLGAGIALIIVAVLMIAGIIG